MPEGWTKTHLPLTKRPKIYPHPDNIIQRGIRPLIQQRGAQRKQRVHNQPRLDATVQARARQRSDRPLPGEGAERHEQVDDLEDGEWPHGAVEVFGEEVPEDLRPEEAGEGGESVVGRGGEKDEAAPVVFYELAHGGVVLTSRLCWSLKSNDLL